MRIAIANDVVLAVESLRLALQQSSHDIAWVAYDGLEALNNCRIDPPDLLLLDLYMPIMDGVQCARHIMAECPCPILIVTASVTEHAAKVFEAMGVGALDATDTPIIRASGSVIAEELYEKIRIIERLTKPIIIATREKQYPKLNYDTSANLVVFGASSGGPQALASLLGQLPPDFSGAVALVQHIDSRFISEFSTWLGKQISLPVRVAEVGDEFSVGEVLVANTCDDLVLDGTGQLRYMKSLPGAVFQPSIDVFFSSVAAHWSGFGIGVLLTGMGRDGALGLLELSSRGFFTIAQDEHTSAVFGMPRAAIELNAARQILPLEEIPHVIQRCVKTRR